MSVPQKEKQVLNFWKEINAFQKSLEISKTLPPFIVMFGPPFSSGLPHYGHLVSCSLKDIIPRYKTQMGYYVARQWGFDTHGLPIEFEIEKLLGIKTRQEVLDFGIGNYNNECRKIVMRCSQQWRETIDRMGFWVDMDNDYKTMDLSFMESVWNVFQKLYLQGLVYHGQKIMPYSTACGTPLSNNEAKSNYKKVSDPSLVIKFPLLDRDEEYFLVWTTTPWTLPSNLALCLHPDLEYALVDDPKTHQKLWLSSSSIPRYFKNEVKILDKKLGHQLADLRYQPLFDYFYSQYGQQAFKTVIDKYVSDQTGTGIVHQAPAFGQDDQRVCLKYGIIHKGEDPPCPLDTNGYFTQPVVDYLGQHLKDAETPIIIELKKKGLMFDSKRELHDYPFCWRSNTPLIYRNVPAWFVNIEPLKDKIIANTLQTRWVPQHVRDGRFINLLKDAPDWCFSRNRFWGTPIPLWISDDGEEVICIGSIHELEELANLQEGSVTDLHRDKIDQIIIPSRQGKGMLHRIDEVFDCWFESGAVPYASQAKLKIPADFIAEGVDQTRGWFYTLMVLSTALFDQPAFKNLIVNGLVLADDGEKMSKSKRNYPPPSEVLDEYGADALRLYLMGSPVVRAEDLKFNKADIKKIVSAVHFYLHNILTYFQQMVDLYQKIGETQFRPFNVLEIEKQQIQNPLNHWILELLDQLIREVHQEMDQYQVYRIPSKFYSFIDKLSRWYLNLNKHQLKTTNVQNLEECYESLSVLFNVIHHLMLIMSPFTPFLSESFYQELKNYFSIPMPESIHFLRLETKLWDSDQKWLKPMKYFEKVINLVRSLRTKNQKIRSFKMPISQLLILHPNPEHIKDLQLVEELLYPQVNAMEIKYDTDVDKYYDQDFDICLKLNHKLIGQTFKQKDAISQITKSVNGMKQEKICKIVKSGSFVVDNKYTITKEMYSIERKLKTQYKNKDFGLDGELLVFVDTHSTEDMLEIYRVRLLVRQIQNARREAGLVPSDFIKVYYQTTSQPLEQCNMICSLLNTPFNEYQGEKTFFNKEVEILDQTIQIMFAHKD